MIPGPPPANAAMPPTQDKYQVYRDDSDWWSLMPNSRCVPMFRLRSQHGARFMSSEEVLGFPVGRISVDAGAKVERKMGDADVIVRPGRQTVQWDEDYRRQICYESPSGRVKLIFEDGGAFDGEKKAFYLFTGGRGWQGSERCRPSRLVNDHLAVRGGLRLGMTREQVAAILGRPSAVTHGALEYAYETNPPNAEGADGWDGMVIRFTDSRVSYIGVLTVSGD